MQISVVIPAYKHTEMFLRNMRHNMQFLEGCQIIVVNDDPEGSLQPVMAEFSSIQLIEHAVNKGFGPTVNDGVAEATYPYVLLLNTDVRFQDDSFLSVLENFTKDPSLFAVSFLQIEKDGSKVGKNRIYWHKGFLLHSKAKDLDPGPTAWAEGGSCIVRKDMFDKLGGFDPLYAPFYWEDIDLSYRARKLGYTVQFVPSVQVEHHHESTIGTYFQKKRVQAIAYRNQFLFVWRNIREPLLLLSHVVYLPVHLVHELLVGNWAFLKGFVSAVGRIPTGDRREESYNGTLCSWI